MKFSNNTANCAKVNSKFLNKGLYTFLLVILFSFNAFAQRPNREKIKALKIAHITEQLDLTETEAQKFWPVYNANEASEDKLRAKSNQLRKEKRSEELTETEAKSLLLKMVALEKEEAELKSTMVNNLLEVLPPKKVIALFQAERAFKRKMIEEYKSRYSDRKRRN